jgi:putative pyruvate formate lyase activating enzyme
VFFSGCNLRCVFCQNHDISTGAIGRIVTPERLREIFFELIAQGVHNINMVTAAHYLDGVLAALGDGLPVPVVWNSGGYESIESIKKLSGKVQIYLPDMKYSDSAAARRYSAAVDYPEVAKAAIVEMVRQVGRYEIDDNGIMRRGVIIRHLVLPGNLDNTLGVLDWISETFKPGEVLVSLMSQFTPVGDLTKFPELQKRLTPDEYAAAMSYMDICGLTEGYRQELSSAKEEYTPPFDLTGV